jgi:molecular chaperone HscB
MIDFTRNHFELLGLPARYRVDEAALERAYRDLQNAVHPDRYAAAGDADKRLALQASARVNEAFRTLRDPVARAEYLLELRGVDAASEADTRLPIPFLTRQLERREQAEEASDEHDLSRLAALVGDVRADAAAVASDVERALDANDDARARARVRELRFLAKLAEDIEALGAVGIDE